MKAKKLYKSYGATYLSCMYIFVCDETCKNKKITAK